MPYYTPDVYDPASASSPEGLLVGIVVLVLLLLPSICFFISYKWGGGRRK